MIFTDEWGGGTRPRCRATDPPTWGADAIFEIVDRKLRFAGYYKLPAPQTEQENCVAHNGSLIPVPGRDIMVQAWYQGGVSVFDFTDSAHPVEIAFFDRGPLDAKQLITGGFWSAYWYNGHIYGAEIARGIDVFQLMPSEHLTQERDRRRRCWSARRNSTRRSSRASSGRRSPVVARAYLDQLTRAKAIQPARVSAVTTALDRVEKAHGNDSGATTELESLSTQLANDAAAASGRDAVRLRALAETIKQLR